jgi:hypothetical protein
MKYKLYLFSAITWLAKECVAIIRAHNSLKLKAHVIGGALHLIL